MCSAPHLSSGKERRTGAIVVVSFELPGRLVAQSGMQVMRVVRGDPSAQGTDEGKGTAPFLEPEALLLEGAHQALGIGIALGIVLAGKGLMDAQGTTRLDEGQRRRLAAVIAHQR